VMFTLNPGYNRWATSPEGPFQVILPVDNAELLLASLEKIDASALMRWDQVVVKSGDTLSHISARHNVPVSVLRTSNNLNTDLIRVGQKLRLPRDDQTMIDPYYTQASMELQNLQSGLISTKRVTHRVRSGENLSVIANRYRVSVADLRRWNKISDPRKLRAGTTITVYQSPKQMPAPTSGTIRHVVQHGDSLWKIARKYNVKVDDIRNWNGMNGETVLHPGQAIRIEL
jgi:membrane-bound lytic murein transglycosylase D